MSTAPVLPFPAAAPTIDVGRLYLQLSRRLQLIVESEVNAPEAVIEDACQIAWARLIRHAHRVDPPAVLSWLVCTAKREAVKLLKREQRDISLEAVLESGAEDSLAKPGPGVDEMAAQRLRIASLQLVALRQRRVLWLHAAGLNYREIAIHEGDTVRTVQRQLLRARDAARAVTG